MTSLAKSSLALFLCLIITDTRGQLTHTFTEMARNGDQGSAVTVAVGPDGIVFGTFVSGGLWAFEYDGASLVSAAHTDADPPIIRDGMWQGVAVAVDSDGTVFLANDWDGLRAYGYDGASFTSTAHVDDTLTATGVALGPEGTVLLTQQDFSSRLRAYRYDGMSFTQMAEVGVGLVTVGVTVSPHGTVFTASAGYCQPTAGCVDGDGLRAYSYDGRSLVEAGHVHDQGWAEGVAVAPDGTVFLANGDDGLRAYAYDGASFTSTAHVNDGGFAKGVAVSVDGTVFLASGKRDRHGLLFGKSGEPESARTWWDVQDGQDQYTLRAYRYDGRSFTNTASTDQEGPANGAAVGPDGTVFLATSSGLIAYTYSVNTASEGEHPEAPSEYSLSQNYPNPFNPSTRISYTLPQATDVTLTVYDLLGREVRELASSAQLPGTYVVTFDATGLPSGVYFYRLQAGDYVETRRMVAVR